MPKPDAEPRSTGRRPTRRSAGTLLIAGGLGSFLFGGRATAAETVVGTVAGAQGEVFARLSSTRPLKPAGDVFLGDLVWTGAASRAQLDLEAETRLHLGPKARLKIDRYIATVGGDLVLGEGAVVFDRPDNLPAINLEIRSSYGLIGVRGTRFFAGPSRGVFGVFVERGAVSVSAGGVVRRVAAGYGVDIRAPGGSPSLVARWGRPRIDEAMASVLG